jgi:uncharacterized membrane protein YuzA (DUF378 family)
MKAFDRTKEMTGTQTKLVRIVLAFVIGFAGLYLDFG